jgi:hypothetical protein
MSKKLLFFSFALAMICACVFLASETKAATTVGANITSAGILTVATTTPYNGFLDVAGDLNQSANYKIYQNYLPVFVASSTSKSLSVGTEAGKNLTDGGVQNTFLGYQAGYTNTTADSNTGVGYQALHDNTTGAYNTALGDYALFFNTTGSGNIGIGFLAFLGGSAVGSSNIAIGTSAGVRSGSKNIALGDYTQNNITDAFANVGVGYMSGGSSGSYSSSTIMGYKALSGSVTGDGNIALGYQAADNISSGSNNIVIGYDIDAPSATGSNRMSIGNLLFGRNLDGTGTSISSGGIGIATTTPGGWYGERLTVVGNTYTRGTATTTGDLIIGDGNATATSTVEIGDIDTAGCFKIRDADADAWTYCYTDDGNLRCSTTNVCGK